MAAYSSLIDVATTLEVNRHTYINRQPMIARSPALDAGESVRVRGWSKDVAGALVSRYGLHPIEARAIGTMCVTALDLAIDEQGSSIMEETLADTVRRTWGRLRLILNSEVEHV